jgi:hypothetical protein
MNSDFENKLDELAKIPSINRLVSKEKTEVFSNFRPFIFNEGGVWEENDEHFRKRILEIKNQESK